MPKYSPKNFEPSGENAKYRTVSLVLTNDCNLKCSYCYEKHDLRDSAIMDIETGREAVSRYLDMDDDFQTVVIDFFGGEPLLAFPQIKEIFTWVKKQEWEKNIQFTVSTNGTLLDDEMKRWFTENRDHISVGLSIDGNREAHNINRDNSFDLIYPHLDFFKTNWPYQPAKMTVSAETIPHVADSIIELEKMGLYFTANIPFENIWGDENNKKRLLEIYKAQLARLVDFYVENVDLYPVYPMLGILPVYLGIPGENSIPKSDCVRYCGAGHEMIVIDINGKEYPCHRFLPWTTGKESPNEPVNRQTSWLPEKCNNCNIVKSCPTCAGYNWEINNNTGCRSTFHCDSHKLEVMAAAKITALRLRKIPMSSLEKLTDEERIIVNDNLRTILELAENDVV